MQSTATPGAAAALIDSRPLSAYQRLILVLCGSVIFLDGLDTQSISVATKARRTSQLRRCVRTPRFAVRVIRPASSRSLARA